MLYKEKYIKNLQIKNDNIITNIVFIHTKCLFFAYGECFGFNVRTPQFVLGVLLL